LGVEWEPVAPGKLAAEITGVPRAVLRDQSRRRQEIVQRMEERGESSPRAAQAAALDTRKAKDYDVDRRDVALELRTRIAAKGLGPAELAGIVDRQRMERPTNGEVVRLSRRQTRDLRRDPRAPSADTELGTSPQHGACHRSARDGFLAHLGTRSGHKRAGPAEAGTAISA
jgi:hypothetical protein